MVPSGQLGFSRTPIAAPSGGDAFFQMDLTAGASPTYGFTSLGAGHEAARTHAFVANGGAGGRHCVEIRLTPLTQGSQPAADCRCGWSGVANWPTFTQGESLYFRAYLEHEFTGTPRSSVDAGVWGGKEVIINAATDNWRIIQSTTDPDWPSTHPFVLSRNIDGPPYSTWDETSFAQKLILPTNTPYAVQWEVKTGPTAGGGGRLAVWVNTDVYASPTRTSGTDLALDASPMFGGPQMWQSINPLLNNGATLTLRISKLEFGKTFNATWASSL